MKSCKITTKTLVFHGFVCWYKKYQNFKLYRECMHLIACSTFAIQRHRTCMTQWLHDTMAAWHNGCMAQWLHDAMAAWRNGCMTQWLHDTMAAWHNGCMTQCHAYANVSLSCMAFNLPKNNTRHLLWFLTFIKLCCFTIWAATSENRSSGFPIRSDTNRAVQPQKMARDLKFGI